MSPQSRYTVNSRCSEAKASGLVRVRVRVGVGVRRGGEGGRWTRDSSGRCTEVQYVGGVYIMEAAALRGGGCNPT